METVEFWKGTYGEIASEWMLERTCETGEVFLKHNSDCIALLCKTPHSF